MAKVTIKVVEDIEKADGERFQHLSYNLGADTGKMEEIISYSQLVDHLEATANKENETNADLYKLRSLIGHQGPPMAPNPNLKRCKYNVLVEWDTGEKTHEPLPVLAADDPVTCASYTKGNGISHIDGLAKFKNLAKRNKHDLSCITSPKGEMKSTFSWTSLFKSPTSSTLCFGEPTLGKLNQVKLLCSPTSSILCEPVLAKLNHIKLSSETEFCIIMHIPLYDPVVHTGTTFSVSRSSSETDRVSDCKSSLVTTPSSRVILDKLKIEMTKDSIHHVGKNGEHFYVENYIYENPTKRHIKSNQYMGILHTFSNCVRETFNHGLSPSEVDWGDPKGEPTKMLKDPSNGCMLMEVDWEGKLKLNYTSSRCMVMEVDWGGKLILNSMVDWGDHETHPNGHSLTEVDWGGHDVIPNHMNEFLLSEVDWGAHDSSFFLFLANIDYDAKPMEFFTQGLWEELQQKMSSTLLIGYLTD